MNADGWTCAISRSGEWLCEHVHNDGTPASPTSLNAASATLEIGARSNRRGSLYCPDCGTLWRVWPDHHIAKFYIEFPPPLDAGGAPPRLRHKHTPRDIDRIIAQVHAAYPDLIVTQHQYVWPADSETLWWFDRPGKVWRDIQIESLEGNCPFLVETDELSSYDSRTAQTVPQAVQCIVDELSRPRPES